MQMIKIKARQTCMSGFLSDKSAVKCHYPIRACSIMRSKINITVSWAVTHTHGHGQRHTHMVWGERFHIAALTKCGVGKTLQCWEWLPPVISIHWATKQVFHQGEDLAKETCRFLSWAEMLTEHRKPISPSSAKTWAEFLPQLFPDCVCFPWKTTQAFNLSDRLPWCRATWLSVYHWCCDATL